MKTLSKKWQKTVYGMAGMGINMLNLMVGSYLCSALLTGGFGEAAIPFQTFEGRDLVVAGVWAVFVLIAKIIDGVIDVPMASFADNLKTRWGRRRPALLIGLAVTVGAYLMFLITPVPTGVSIINTIYFALVLCAFYSFYTLTMVTYYATFTEIVDKEEDRQYLSNVKSICDIVYFILGYVGVTMLLKGINIRVVSLIVLPLSCTMIIPMFLIKEESTKGLKNLNEKEEKLNMFKSLAYTFKNRDFIIWMSVYEFMNFGVQLFLGGINEYFSKTGMSMIFVMLVAFIPTPLTLMLYNKIIKKKGFKFAFQYVLLTYSVGMLMLFGFSFLGEGTLKTVLSIISGLLMSLSVGALFAVAYAIPSQLAAEDEKRTGKSHSAMYFAVQGLFSGVATGIGTGLVLTALKGTEEHPTNAIIYLTLLSAVGCLISFVFAYFLPKSVKELGKENKEEKIAKSL